MLCIKIKYVPTLPTTALRVKWWPYLLIELKLMWASQLLFLSSICLTPSTHRNKELFWLLAGLLCSNGSLWNKLLNVLLSIVSHTLTSCTYICTHTQAHIPYTLLPEVMWFTICAGVTNTGQCSASLLSWTLMRLSSVSMRFLSGQKLG